MRALLYRKQCKNNSKGVFAWLVQAMNHFSLADIEGVLYVYMLMLDFHDNS